MNKLSTVTAFSAFLILGFVSNDAWAQETIVEAEADIEYSYDEEPSTVLDWPDLNLELAPLEEVPIPPVQRSTGARGERQTYLQLEEPSPWDGILFNPSAVAYLIAEFGSIQDRAKAALQRQRESDWNRLTLEVEQLQLRIQSDRRQAEIVVEGLQREVQRRIEIHQEYVEETSGGFFNTKFGKAIKWGLAILGSAAVGGLVGYFIGSITP